MVWPPACSILFPYTTLFRSVVQPFQPLQAGVGDLGVGEVELAGAGEGAQRLHPGVRHGGRPEAQRPQAGEVSRSEEHTSELQSLRQLVCRLLLETKELTKLN